MALPVSLILHAALLGWALVSFDATPPLKIPEVQPVEVALISPDDLVRLRQGDRNSKKLETRKAKTPEKTKPKKKKVRKAPPRAVAPPQASEPPPKPTAEPAKVEPAKPQKDKIAEKLAALQPLPTPGPTPEELKKKADAERKAKEAKRKAAEKKKKKAEAKRKAAAKRKAEAKKRAERRRKKKLAEKRRREREKRKQTFNDRMAALINKMPDRSAPSGSQDSRPDKKLPKGPRAGAPEGRDSLLTASERSLLGTIIDSTFQPNWRINCGVEGIERIVVKVEIRFRPDGYLAAEPKVVNSSSSPLFRPAADLALAAIKISEPVNWPKKFYRDGWDAAIVNFPAKQACSP